MSLKSTPLKGEHESLGARMVDFAGWFMPVEYQGLRAEHMATRTSVGLFDVSHMGEIRFRGPKALESVEWLCTNFAGKLEDGQAQYSLLPNDQGGLVDDLIVYCVKTNQDYLLCVNASNIEADEAWMRANNRGAEIINESAQWGQIAVQGPKALALIERVLGSSARDIARFTFRFVKWQGAELMVARTGYTGEDGVEVFVPAAQTVTLWRELMAKGADLGVTPVGLGARDTLRTEAKYPLYGHEINAELNPYAAGLGWVIKPEKKDFVGRAKIVDGKSQVQHQLVGVRTVDRGIPRQGYKLFADSSGGEEIGWITSGTVAPSLNENIGIAYIKKPWAAVGSSVFIDIRGRKVATEVVKTPFVPTV